MRRLLALSPVLVADIEARQLASNPTDFTPAGEWAYFLAEDAIHGRELWRTDGTTEKTSLVADLAWGVNSADISEMTAVGDQLYFAYNGDLWRTDDANGGVVQVRDLSQSLHPFELSHLTAAGDRLFFVGYEPSQRQELWISDGTAAGTFPLTANSDLPTLIDFQFTAAAESGLYFVVERGGSDGAQELWKSDGSVAGTTLVRSFDHHVGYEDFAVAGNVLLFSAYEPSIGSRPWRSDGTLAGTSMLADIPPSDFGLQGWEFTTYGESVVFRGYDEAEQDVAWITDGTVDGTHKLMAAATNDFGGSPHLFTPHGDSLYFVADHDVFGREVWRYDSVTGHAAMIANVFPEDESAQHVGLIAAEASLFYLVEREHPKLELWETDGTEFGTHRLLAPPVETAEISRHEFSAVGARALFRVRQSDGETEPWVSDGTIDGTLRLSDIHTGSSGSSPTQLTPMGDMLYFTAYSSLAGGPGLWRTPIGGIGAELVKGGFPANSASQPQNLAVSGSRLFFTVHDRELWVSDGTHAGTKLLKILVPDGSTSRILRLFDLHGQLVVVSDDGRQLWTSDGTPEGTVLVKQFEAGRAEVLTPAILGDELHFFVRLAHNSFEHWKTDGTASGAQFIQPVNTFGGSGDNIKELVSDGERLFFSARNEDATVTLWTSDGTAAGTHRLAESQSLAVDPRGLSLFGSNLYFSATGASTGRELWRSDGTSEGTVLVADLKPGVASSFPHQFTVVGDSLYFVASSQQAGRDIWRVNAAGIQRIEFVEPFEQLQEIYNLTSARGAVFFAGYREGIGKELWRADASGVEIVPGFLPGSASSLSSNAGSMARVGDHFYYAASDLQSGRELRRLTVEDGDTNFDGDIDLEDLNNVRNNFGKTGGALGDADGDGVVDLSDLNHVRNYFGSAGANASSRSTMAKKGLRMSQHAFVAATDLVFQLFSEEKQTVKKAATRSILR